MVKKLCLLESVCGAITMARCIGVVMRRVGKRKRGGVLMKKMIMMIVMLAAGFAVAEQREFTGTFKAVVGQGATLRTTDGKYISLGVYDGKIASLPGGKKDVSAFAAKDLVKVVIEGTPTETGGFKSHELISIEKCFFTEVRP
jgi:hypothetical protein